MLAQEGAETFARQQGFDMVENEYFYTERRRRAAERARENGPTGDANLPDSYDPETAEDAGERGKFGTVGAVALDRNGNIAAGTSTGGTTNKRFGRIGDSPIIGAGTYADNETCGVSATGHGEYFIRAAAAHSVAARMKFAGMSVEEAARVTVMDELPAMPPNGGSGGVIALDAEGNIAMPFNTQGMYRGYVDTDGNRAVMIYNDE
jgi:beta-aspartyl-peptidase (threonine type)